MIQTKVAKKNQNTYFMFSFENFAVYGIMWKKMVRVRRGARGKIMLHVNDAFFHIGNPRKKYKRSVTIFNTCGFSTATMATLVRLSVALYVHVPLC